MITQQMTVPWGYSGICDRYLADLYVKVLIVLVTKANHATFDASEHILLQPFSRSSAATTPLTLVPSNSRCIREITISRTISTRIDKSLHTLLLSSTAALSSKRIHLPSGRRVSFLVRTMTARLTSPLLTLLAAAEPGAVPVGTGRAFLTTTTISSPGIRDGIIRLREFEMSKA
jgi:hypothetical protein